MFRSSLPSVFHCFSAGNPEAFSQCGLNAAHLETLVLDNPEGCRRNMDKSGCRSPVRSVCSRFLNTEACLQTVETRTPQYCHSILEEPPISGNTSCLTPGVLTPKLAALRILVAWLKINSLIYCKSPPRGSTSKGRNPSWGQPAENRKPVRMTFLDGGPPRVMRVCFQNSRKSSVS